MKLFPKLLLICHVMGPTMGCINHSGKESIEYAIELAEGNYSIFQLDSLYLHALYGHFEDTMKIATLSHHEVPKIEELITKEMTKNIKRQEEEFQVLFNKDTSYRSDKRHYVMRLKDYGRQYTAAHNSSGEKIVFVNCYCGATDWKKLPGWEGHIYTANGGGNCYFQLWINLNTGKVLYYTVNQ